MMRLVLYALALVLAAAGVAALYLAVDLVGIERGTMYAICGAVAVSAAAIVFALAIVVGRLDALAAALRRQEPAPSAPMTERPLAPVVAAVVAAELAAPGADVEAPPPAPPAKPAPVAARRLDTLERDAATAGQARARPAPAAPPAVEPAPRVEIESKPPPKPDATAPAPPNVAAPRVEPRPPSAEEALDWLERGLADAPTAPAASAPEPPRIVGRYQASGVDYVMFSDGSIEADNGGARRRFGSMDELKAFIAEPTTPRG